MASNDRPSAGDMTGRLKAQDAKKQQQVTQERQQEMSMATAAQEEEERTGVFDPRSGQMVEDEARTAVLVEAPPEEPDPGFFRSDEPVMSGRETDEEVAAILEAQKARPRERQTHTALNPIVRVRIDQDVEKMTYGMHNNEPNNFNFKEGLQYDVPREVAEHLEERGLIRQWVRR